MIDFLLGLYLAGLAVRGWLRGLVRESLDLVGLVLGAAVAFRLSGPVGDFLTDRFGVTSEWARLGAGVVLFVVVGIGLAIVARIVSRILRLPGLNLVNRIGGAAVAAAWGAVLLAVILTVLRALPIPSVNEAVEDSTVAAIVAGPDSVPGRLIATVGGARVATAMALLDKLAGGRRVVIEGDEVIELEPVPGEDLSVVPASADELYRMLNDSRLAAGSDPLAWSHELALVAEGHALEMYRDGYLAHVSPSTGVVGDRVRVAGVRLTVVGEAIGLASTTRAAHSALLESPPNRATLTAREFDRVGIGVIDGPYGKLVVEVTGG
ncbi:MAG TPA: CvpA family protein [Acidimicrobiia bacterium]|nr:CvpA family protein [Acidimicrobiia bacterium]